MTLKHAKELEQFGQQIDVKVTIHEMHPTKLVPYITLRDYEITDFIAGAKILKQIQETEQVQDHSFMIY